MDTRQPLKILLLTTSFPLTRESRSGIFVRTMIEHLPDKVQVTVLTPDDSSTEQPDLPGKYSLVPFRYAPKKWQQLAHGSGGIVAALSRNKFLLFLLPPFLFSCLLTCCRETRRADVLHANWSINGVIAGIAGLLFRRPVITTLRGSDVNLTAKSGLMRQLVRFCLICSRHIVTVSPSLKATLVKQFPQYSSKISVVANGIDQAFFSAGEKKESPERKAIRFLYAGNLVPGKGVHCILEAAASLAAPAANNWLLDIVGDGPERDKLEAYCQKNRLENKVIFHGSVAPEEVPQFMARADVFVFASFAEGRPNAVLEAMASGLPVIVGAIPAVLELIENGEQGLLFSPGDAGILAEHMLFLINSPAERRKMGRKAREAIRAMGLSWQEAARQYAEIYMEVTRQSSSL
ncbi:MAG: glycosyltransferase family 4 protein [Candidatus Electrothrix sp. YB6]